MNQPTPTNSIQISILRELARSDALRFSEMNEDKIPSDQFSYHIRQLVKHGYIQKNSDALYALSEQGRGLTLKLDKTLRTYTQRGLIGTLAVITKRSRNTEYILLQKRTRHPDRGKHVLPGGQVLFGERVEDAIQRVIHIETGLTARFEFIGTQHILRDEIDEPQQDLYFFYYKALDVVGDAAPSGPNGENIWVPTKQFEGMDHIAGVREAYTMAKSKNGTVVGFREIG